MLLLLIFLFSALIFSFYCSVSEAVLLSISRPYVALMEEQDPAMGQQLRRLKDDINKPLAAILTLNTIAHTIGAAGVGAQAAAVFGNAYLGIVSVVMTLLILVFSEIIPKTLGAHYWRPLARPVVMTLRWLVPLLYPFVKLSEWLTKGITHGETTEITRHEMATMADLGEQAGELAEHESKILRNVFALQETPIRQIMTPRAVVFSLKEDLTASGYLTDYKNKQFSRIPVFTEQPDDTSAFVLRSDLLEAVAEGRGDTPLSSLSRSLTALYDGISVLQAYETMTTANMQIAAVIDEYGDLKGIVTLEDVIETLLGLEIVDESDKVVDMQLLARKLWKRRAKRKGTDIDE